MHPRSGLTTAATVGIVVAALIAAVAIYRFGFADGRDQAPDTTNVIVDDRGFDGNGVPSERGFDDHGGDRDGDDRGGSGMGGPGGR